MKLFNGSTTCRPRTVTALAALVALMLVLPLTAGGASSRSTAQATVPLGNAATFGALSFSPMTN
jgi:hypothetical protein